MQTSYELSGFHSASGSGAVDSWFGLYGTMYASSKGPKLRDCTIRSASIVFPVCSNDSGVILRVTRGGVLMQTEELPGRQNGLLSAPLSGASLAAFAAEQGKVSIQVFVHNGDKSKFFKTRQDRARIVVNYVPHTSSLTLSSGTVAAGGSVTATITAHDKAFGHRVQLTLGNRVTSWNVNPGVGSAQVDVPMEWLDQLPHASTGAATVTLETLSGTQVLGKVSQPLTVTVPASAAPTFTASCAPLLSVGGVTYPSMGAGVYVQGKSGCTAQITGAAAKYGAGVASYSIRGGGYAGTSAALATGLLTQAGAVPFVFRVTDTRGLVTEKTVSITVKPYAPPQVTELRGWRVNEGGAASLSGARGMVRSVWGFSALDGANTCTAAIYLRPGTEAEKPLNAAMVSGETYPIADASGSLTLPLTVTYTLRLVLTDKYGAVERTATLPSANFAMHFNAKGNSVAFGKACEHENAFEIAPGRVVYCQGGKMNALMGVMDAVDDCDKALRSGVYSCPNTAANLPLATWGTLLVMTGLVEFEHKNGTIEQLFIPLGGGIWRRGTYNDQPWSAWVTLAGEAYPVGSVWMTANGNDNPLYHFGGSWVQLSGAPAGTYMWKRTS